MASVLSYRLIPLSMHEIRSFVNALVYIFSKVVLSSNKGCLMISNKEDVQNNMKKSENLCRAWRGSYWDSCLSAVLKASKELDQVSV